MNKVFTQNAWADYIYWQTEDKKTLKKLINLLKMSVEMEIPVLENQNRC